MTIKKISEYPEQTSLLGSYELILNAGGTTKKALASTLLKWVQGSSYNPSNVPDSPNTLDDEFDGTTLDTSTKWTVQSGSVTGWTVANKVLTCQTNAGWMSQPISGSAWTMEIKQMMPLGFAGTNNNSQAIWVGRTTKQTDFGMWRNGAGAEQWIANRWNSYAWSSAVINVSFSSQPAEVWTWMHMRLTLASGTITWSVSTSGVPGSFRTVGTEATASHLGGDPDVVGISKAGTAVPGMVEYFRRIA